jgi:hypothetical protein
MKVIFVLVLVLLVGLAAGGSIHFSLQTSSSGSPSTTNVLGTSFEPGKIGELNGAVGAVYELADRAPRTARGATRVRRRLPSLVARYDLAASALREHLSGLDLGTDDGRRYRAGFLRFLAKQQWMIHRFRNDIARKRPTWAAVRRLRARRRAWSRRWQAYLDAFAAQLDAGGQ